MARVKIKWAGGTDIGLTRKNNEDSFAVSGDLSSSEWSQPQDRSFRRLSELGALLIVADGMGGYNAGEVASSIAVRAIQDYFLPEQASKVIHDDLSVLDFMKAAVSQANASILDHARNHPETSGMGTTVVMAWILGQKVYVCWCGDSRCYVLNKRNGLLQLSKDHSYVQELVDKGQLSPEQMHDHPLSNVITRCLGDQYLAQPETNIYHAADGDVIMHCSDGLCGFCDDDLILATMRRSGHDPQTCREELISAALSCGGYDNVTVAVANIVIGRKSHTSFWERLWALSRSHRLFLVQTCTRGRRAIG